MNWNVISAIFRRNFYSYFANPTGYVFILVFVLLSSFAAFWPNDFFSANLANLDQLNRYLPYILLMFIPAITMSIWAEERRQGTDELLLTIPAGDFDVVAGKYLAAVAIYSVALLYSLVCNLLVLEQLGNPDWGLFFGTYFGYWVVGLAMLSIGMVASFLTGNLTVGFVLGAVFNAPLAFFANAEAILPPDIALKVKTWSLEEQFRDFGRGVVSLSSAAFFLMIVTVMLYLSMVLIGRRHWAGGKNGRSMAGHYLIRVVCLVVLVVGANLILKQYDRRMDVTSEQLSTLTDETIAVINKLSTNQPVRIDAFVSPSVPESYVQTRLNLISTLDELDARGGNKIVIRKHATMPLSREADQAEQQYGITSRSVFKRSRGAMSQEEIYLGVALNCGLDRVVIPFFDRGIPVEYELVRSIGTVSQQSRKKIGVLTTDAKLFGGMNFQTFQPQRNELLIDELEKQYEVVQINADTPINTKIDALLAVQPSSLGPEQMQHLIDAVRSGTPTAIFEDPFPAMAPGVPATTAPRRPPQQMNPFGGMNQPPPPKGDITLLWELLEIDFSGGDIVWQRYNPVRKLAELDDVPEFVFVDSGASEQQVFHDQDPISSKLQQMVFPYPGSITKLNTSKLRFDELVRTGNRTGIVTYDDLFTPNPFGGGGMNPQRQLSFTGTAYVLAAHIQGRARPARRDLSMSDEDPSHDHAADEDALDDPTDDTGADDSPDAKPAKGAGSKAKNKKTGKKRPKARDMNVVLVADIDLMYSQFFEIRSRGSDPDVDLNLNFDNVTFVLNVLDVLADDERFVEIRKRRPQHRILQAIEDRTEEARQKAIEEQNKFDNDLTQALEKEQQKFKDEIAKIEKQEYQNPIEKAQRVAQAKEVGEQRLQVTKDRLQKDRDRKVNAIQRDLTLEVSRVQDRYKLGAVSLPPIPVILLGLWVYFGRRAREREGVSRTRLL